MTISKVRSQLYRIARVLGDVSALQRGRVGKRVGRRVTGRFTGQFLSRLFR